MLPLFAALLILPVTAFAQIHLILSGGFRAPYAVRAGVAKPALRLVTFLKTKCAQAAIKASGMEPIE